MVLATDRDSYVVGKGLCSFARKMRVIIGNTENDVTTLLLS